MCLFLTHSNGSLKPVLLFVCIFFSLHLRAQQEISLKVIDQNGNPVESVLIEIQPGNQSGVTSDAGGATFQRPPGSTDTLRTYLIGFRSLEEILTPERKRDSIVLVLTDDPLQLDAVVVTASYDPQSKFNTSSSVSTLTAKQIRMQPAIGTAELLQSIPGVFADASAGEVFTRVFSRGISASAEDDIGWYYNSLQEDGLPVTSVNYTYYGPDFFFRQDLTTSRLEAVRGGSASIIAPNAPGGIFHFISGRGGEEFGGQVALSTTIQGDGNGLYRVDGVLGGPLSPSNLRYQVGGFYRYDEGPRNTDITWGRGGQVKANLSYTPKAGEIRLFLKYLNDQVNRYTGVAATNWDDPEPAFGQDFGTTALMLPETSVAIPQGRDMGLATLDYETDRGIRTREFATGLNIDLQLSPKWRMSNALKYSHKRATWNSTIANQPLGLENFLAYFLSGYENPWGEVVFRDARTQEELARVDNLGALNIFQGLPPTFEYISGQLPNDALMGIAPWQKDDEVREIMNQLKLSRRFGDHQLNTGVFFSYADVRPNTQASYAYATYETAPGLLSVTLENPGSAPIQLSDLQGISNYGGLLYQNGRVKATQIAGFVHDAFQVTPELTLDGGIRYEYVRHDGEKDRFAPVSQPGGLDGDTTTGFDHSTLLATGTVDAFDFSYDYLSFSLGGNYRFSDAAAVFARFSLGHKSPELNYYLNNFANIPVDQGTEVQRILQAETGIKYQSRSVNVFATLFWSRLEQIPFSEFVFDQSGSGGIFFTPVQLNKTTTAGLELETIFQLTRAFKLELQGTLQRGVATEFTIYDAGGTVETEDDQILDYSGNTLPHTPDIMLNVKPMYQSGPLTAFVGWQLMGARQANVSNGFQLPAFQFWNAGVEYQLTTHLSAGANIYNAFNSTGLMNFFGPNTFGSNANAATPEFVAENPDAGFVVFPIAPRRIQLKMAFTW